MLRNNVTQTGTIFRATKVFVAVSGHFELLFVAKLRKFKYFWLGRRCWISRLHFAPRKRGPDSRKQQCCRIATMMTKAHKEKVQRRQGAGHITTGSHVAPSAKQNKGYGTVRQYI